MKTEGDSNLHFNKEEMYKAIDEALSCGATVSIDEYLNGVYVQPKQSFKHNDNDMYKKDNDINMRAMEHRRKKIELENKKGKSINVFMFVLFFIAISGVILVIQDIVRDGLKHSIKSNSNFMVDEKIYRCKLIRTPNIISEWGELE